MCDLHTKLQESPPTSLHTQHCPQYCPITPMRRCQPQHQALPRSSLQPQKETRHPAALLCPVEQGQRLLREQPPHDQGTTLPPGPTLSVPSREAGAAPGHLCPEGTAQTPAFPLPQHFKPRHLAPKQHPLTDPIKTAPGSSVGGVAASSTPPGTDPANNPKLWPCLGVMVGSVETRCCQGDTGGVLYLGGQGRLH